VPDELLYFFELCPTFKAGRNGRNAGRMSADTPLIEAVDLETGFLRVSPHNIPRHEFMKRLVLKL
jgi:hypothetical protein